MKKIIQKITLLVVVVSMSSCATLFGGKVTEAQKTPGNRQLRPAPFIADILLFPPALAVDFITGAIYKPE